MLATTKNRPEFDRTGVYILTGPAETSGLLWVYVGESESIRARLVQHAGQKEFWTQAVFFVSKDDDLNKAHVQYLEARLLEMAREVKRCELDNGNEPNKPSISEADTQYMEGFLDELLVCLPVLGISVFLKPERPAESAARLFLKLRDIEASGYKTADGFVVVAGSTANLDEVPSLDAATTALRKSLVERAILVPDGAGLRVQRPIVGVCRDAGPYFQQPR